MMIELRQLSADDGRDAYEMLQEIPAEENGFMNGAKGKTYEEYQAWLIRNDKISKGIDLEYWEDWMVPQTYFWLYADGVPVAVGKLRHSITDKLRIDGGHIGYAVRPSRRGKGYGKRLLQEICAVAKNMGINELLVTINSDNLPSCGVATSNGFVLKKTENGRCYYWLIQ